MNKTKLIQFIFYNKKTSNTFRIIKFELGKFTHHVQRVLLGVTAESRSKAQRVLVVTEVYWENTHVPHQINTTLDKSLYR